MGARRGGIVALPVLALLVLGACGGSADPLTAEEYVQALADVEGAKAERAEAITAGLVEAADTLDPKFQKVSPEGGAFDRDAARGVARSMVDLLSEFTDVADDALQHYRDDLERLHPPDHLRAIHDGILQQASRRLVLLEAVREAVFDTDIENAEGFNAFLNRYGQALYYLSRLYLPSPDSSFCPRLEAELAAELGREVEICD